MGAEVKLRLEKFPSMHLNLKTSRENLELIFWKLSFFLKFFYVFCGKNIGEQTWETNIAKMISP